MRIQEKMRVDFAFRHIFVIPYAEPQKMLVIMTITLEIFSFIFQHRYSWYISFYPNRTI